MPPSDNRPLRLGVIGLAGYGGTCFKTLDGRADVAIIAICDANPAALQSTAGTLLEAGYRSADTGREVLL